jgi:hypothetical protein
VKNASLREQRIELCRTSSRRRHQRPPKQQRLTATACPFQRVQVMTRSATYPRPTLDKSRMGLALILPQLLNSLFPYGCIVQANAFAIRQVYLERHHILSRINRYFQDVPFVTPEMIIIVSRIYYRAYTSALLAKPADAIHPRASTPWL